MRYSWVWVGWGEGGYREIQRERYREKKHINIYIKSNYANIPVRKSVLFRFELSGNEWQ